MAGEDTVLRLVGGEPTVVSLEDTTHTYAIDVGTVNVGDVVFQSATVDEKVAQADADNSAARPPLGVCLSLPTSTTAIVVHAGGIVTGLSGLTRGSAYWLSTTPGAVTTARPSSNAFIVGVALSATSFLVTCIPADIAATSGTTLQTAYDNGATITTASAVNIAFTTASGNFVVNGPGLVDLGSAGADLSALNVGTGTVTVAATGTILLNSSGGTIGIGTAADAQAISIGTGAAARTITVGNATGATALNLTAGSGGITLTATTASVTGDLLVQGTDIRNDLLESFRWDALSAGTIPSTLGTSNGGAGAESASATNGVTVSGATGTSMAAASRFVGTGARPWRFAGCYRETHESDAPVGLGGYTEAAGEPVYCLSRIRGGGWQLWQDNGAPGVFAKVGGVLAYPDAPWVQLVVPGSAAGATDVHWQLSESGQDGTWTTIATVNFDIKAFTAWVTTPGTTMQVLRYIAGASGNGWNATLGMSTGTAATTLRSGTGTLAVTSGGALNLSGTTGDWQASGALTLDSSGGTISIGGDADAQAINVGTGAAARTITVGNSTGATSLVLNAGTGAINIGTNAVAHTVTVGTTTGAGSTVLQAGTGAMTFTAGGVFDVNAVGALTLDSSGGAISIGADAVAQTINVGTGAAARTITVGNSTGATSLALNCGTGALNVGTNAVAHTVTVGTTTGAGSTVLQAGTGALTFTAGGVFDANAVGAVTIDSSGGAISIGADAVAQAINVGTGAAARTISIGNLTTGTGVTTHAGDEDIIWRINTPGTVSGAGIWRWTAAATDCMDLIASPTIVTLTIGSARDNQGRLEFGVVGSESYLDGNSSVGATSLSSTDDVQIMLNSVVYARFDSGKSGLAVGGTHTVATSCVDVRKSDTGVAVGDFVGQFVNVEATEGAAHAVLRVVIGEATAETDDIFLAGYENSTGATTGTKVFTINGDGALTVPFTGQHFVIYDTASEGTSIDSEILVGLIVESLGSVWSEPGIDDAYLHVTRCATNASKKVYGVLTYLSGSDRDLRLWGEYAGVFNVTSAPPHQTLSAQFTFDGTTTVTSSDTSELSVEDWIWMDGDFKWFRVTAVGATTLTIDPMGNPIPTGSSTVERLLSGNDPCLAYSAMSKHFKAHVNSLGEGLIWVTTFGGEPDNGDYICSSEVVVAGKAGYGQRQADDILRSSTVAKMTEQVDWSAVSDTFVWDGQTHKKKLVACTYHCG